jgi:hypothetical protein
MRRALSYNFSLPEERCDSRTPRSFRLPGSGTAPDGADRNCAHPTMTWAAVGAAALLPSERWLPRIPFPSPR